jgi:putative transposase
VLTLPYRLRDALASDHRLCRAVLGVFIRAVLGFERRRAERRGMRGGAGGAVTAIQRFGSALNVNAHFHTLVAQGVFIEGGEGGRRFVPSPAPTDVEVARLLAAIRRRIGGNLLPRTLLLPGERSALANAALRGTRSG